MKRTRTALMGVLLLLAPFLASCSTWAPGDRDAALAAVDAAEQRGDIDEVAAAAARRAIEEASQGFAGEDIWRMLAEVGGAALLAYLGVQRARGPSKPMQPDEVETMRTMIAQERRRREAEAYGRGAPGGDRGEI